MPSSAIGNHSSIRRLFMRSSPPEVGRDSAGPPRCREIVDVAPHQRQIVKRGIRRELLVERVLGLRVPQLADGDGRAEQGQVRSLAAAKKARTP